MPARAAGAEALGVLAADHVALAPTLGGKPARADVMADGLGGDAEPGGEVAERDVVVHAISIPHRQMIFNNLPKMAPKGIDK